MNGGIGAMYSSPWISYMYIDREPSAHLHSLISLLEITAIKSVTSSPRLPLSLLTHCDDISSRAEPTLISGTADQQGNPLRNNDSILYYLPNLQTPPLPGP